MPYEEDDGRYAEEDECCDAVTMLACRADGEGSGTAGLQDEDALYLLLEEDEG